MQRLIGLLLAVALLAPVAGCVSRRAGGARGAEHTLTIANGMGDPNSLNIHFDPSAIGGYMAELTGAYFARYDQRGQPVPDLVSQIPTQRNGGISPDGRTITWHLRPGLKWSDGQPLTSADVAFTVGVLQNPATNEVQSREGWDSIERVSTPNATTAIFHLKSAYADYLPTFFGTEGDNPDILPKHILGSLPTINNAPFNSKPVGAGPFRVVEWDRGDRIVLEANPYYWRGEPKIKQVIWKIIPSQNTLALQMRSGEVDIWPMTPPPYIDTLKSVSSLNVKVQPNYRTTSIYFVTNRPLVADPRMRRAISMAIDRSRLVATTLHGYGFLYDGIVIPLADPKPGRVRIPYDPSAARAQLDAMGWKPGPDGIRVKQGQRLALQVDYPTGQSELDEEIELLRVELRNAGIDITSKRFAPNLFRAEVQAGGILYAGHFDFTFFAATLTTVADVTDVFGCKGLPPNGENSTRYCSKSFDDLTESLQRTYDPAKRASLFKKLESQFVSDDPATVLYVWLGGTAANKRVTGFDPPALTPFDDMMNVDSQ